MSLPDDADLYPTEAYRVGWDAPPPPAARPSRRRWARPRVLVPVLALIVAVGVATPFVVRAVADDAVAALPVPLTAARDAHAQQLRTGHCLAELPADGSVGKVRAVPCADPHAAEVFSEYAFPAAAVWPGQDAAHVRVAGACQLTDAQHEAGDRFVTWAPSERSWADGDRRGLCLLIPG